MKKSLSMILIAVLAFGIGIAYAAPMLIVPNIQPYPTVAEGTKAGFSVDVVYANFDLNASNAEYPDPVTYNVVLNVTNLSDEAATIYELGFAAAQDISVQDSILGGTIYDNGLRSSNPFGSHRQFGGIIDGVYLDGEWVNITWIPNTYYEDANGTLIEVGYPECLFGITSASWNNVTFQGPLNPHEIESFSGDHTINATIPDLPDNASDTGIWFEGVPITEYYDQSGNHILTMMYINGAWVDVTGRVTVEKTQPMTAASNLLVDLALTIQQLPYRNMNATVGPITALPTWGDWGCGRALKWIPGAWGSQVFGPHESRLIMFNSTQSAYSNGLTALASGKLALYASVSNYITNWPVNGTFYDTLSTATQVKELTFDKTATGYLYNSILGDGETFQQGNSPIEVTIAPRIEP
ncbi:MAG: hypothetical protein NWE93_09975 [Candidatus Bathyarchaeota archaeon]|nr:hypothetical protein [Candidatus Bathyarchaeota archaeon]